MKKWLFVFIFALFSNLAFAMDYPVVCTGVGATDRAAIQSAINGTTTGDTVTITGTCGQLDAIITIGVSPTGRAVTVQGTATINVGTLTTGQAFSIYTEGNKAVRLTGLTIAADPAIHQTSGAAVKLFGSGYNCRVDHNVFTGVYKNLLKSTDAPLCLFDNNTIYMPVTNDTQIETGHDAYPVGGLVNPTATAGLGEGSFATDLMLGNTAALASGVAHYGDALYIEANTFFNCVVVSGACTTAYAEGTLTDGAGGMRLVVRFNNLHGVKIGDHGTEGGLDRGAAKLEIYGNNQYWYSTGNSKAMLFRSGNGVIFNNIITKMSSGNYTLNNTFAQYRVDQGKSLPPYSSTALQWGKCAGWGRYDNNGGSDVYTGTHTGPSDTSVLSDSAANGGMGWTNNQLISGGLRYGIKNTNPISNWYGYEGFVYSNLASGGTYNVYTVRDHTISAVDGKCNLVSRNFATGSDSQPCFTTGDSYAIRIVTKCIDQQGWHPGTGTTLLVPVSSINQPLGWQGNSTPFYVWNNTTGGTITTIGIELINPDQTAGSPTPQTVSVQIPNQDIYNEADSSNADCSSAFNGTCGVGVDILASRPATCTTGVGYWATDQGSWNSTGADGLLYKCTATDTWTLYYTPLNYPHPLVDTTAPVPGNSGAITTASVGTTTLTLNWTKGTDDITPQASLLYQVYKSTSNNISTVANAKANGTIIQAYIVDIAAFAVSGLSPSTTYYFNVLIKDGVGNEAAYTAKSETTAAGSVVSGSIRSRMR